MNVYRAKRRPNKCPNCGSKKVARILYGYPDFNNEEVRQKLDSGDLALGGCELADDAPAWQCVNCEIEILREECN